MHRPLHLHILYNIVNATRVDCRNIFPTLPNHHTTFTFHPIPDCKHAVAHSVRIVQLRVPAVYVVNDPDAGELVLDCEYELDEVIDRGFFLKWLYNDQLVYQWIPTKNKSPQALSTLRNNINTAYELPAAAKAGALHVHRALAILRPTLNMTGTYTCAVDSFKSEDRRSAHMQMVQRESQLRVQIEDSADDESKRRVQCVATDVYPEPQLSML